MPTIRKLLLIILFVSSHQGTKASGEDQRVRSLLENGKALSEKKDFSAAEKIFREAVQLSPNNYDALYNLAESLQTLERYEESLQVCQKAISVDPSKSNSYDLLGVIYCDQKRYQDAVQACKKAEALNPKDFYAPLILGAISFYEKQYKDAIQALTKAASLNPKQFRQQSNNAQFYLGESYYFLGEYEKSIEPFQRALAIQPRTTGVYYFIGSSYFNLKQYEDAVVAYTLEIKLNSANIDAIYWLGESYFRLKQYEKALKFYQEAAAKRPEDFDSHLSLGETYYKLKHYEEALVALQQAKKIKPNDISVNILITTIGFEASLRSNESGKITQIPPRLVLYGILGLALIYLVGSVVLIIKTRRVHDTPLSLLPALGWIFLWFEAQFFVLGALTYLPVKFSAGTFWAVTSAFCALPVIAASCGPIRARLWTWPSSGSSMPVWKVMTYYTLGGLCISFVVFIIYSKAFVLLTGFSLPQQETSLLLHRSWQSAPFLTFLSFAIFMPVAEEIIFRGFLFDALQKYMNRSMTILITALLFSIVHLQLYYLFPLFTLGLILGWTRSKTRTLVIPALIHVLNNGYAILMLLIFNQ